MLRAARARQLRASDERAVRALLKRDPVESVLVAARLGSGVNRQSMGGRLWGLPGDGGLRSLCFSGANLIPVAADDKAIDQFADLALGEGRRCSSIVGHRDAVSRLWDHLAPHWGSARLIRSRQPMMAIRGPSLIAPDPVVRRSCPADMEVLLPASVDMYLEEIGTSPIWHDGGASYRQRIRGLMNAGDSFVRVEDGQVIYKAEIGARTPDCAQIQGVWVRPEYRGQGIGTAATAAVVNATLASGVPIVSLYVNDFNTAAVAAYEKIGFEPVGEFMSVLF